MTLKNHSNSTEWDQHKDQTENRTQKEKNLFNIEINIFIEP